MLGIGKSEETLVRKNLNQIGNGWVHYLSQSTHTEGTSDPSVGSIFIIASE